MSKETLNLTNEEKKLEIYKDSNRPTIAAEVTPKTKLSELNLNWTEKELPEKSRTKHVHRLHPYLGKFIPQLVEVFLRKYFKPGMTVLDPFAGSGTTLIQANELGINSIGYDISAFNVILMRAKAQGYELSKVKGEIEDILHRAHALSNSNDRQLTITDYGLQAAKKNAKDDNNEYLRQWFAPQAREELLNYRDLIKEYYYQDILNVILSRSARSARLTTHFDLDFPKKPQIEPYWCYKHSRICKPVTTAYKFLKRYSLDAIRRIEEYSSLRTDAEIKVVHGDSKAEILPEIDGVITSPPYVGLIDYHYQHEYSYELLGLENRSKLEIGPAKNGTSKKAKLEYQKAVANVFSNACKSMPSGGYLIVVAGDKHNLYDNIAKLCEVEVEAIIKRHVNRRTGRRAGNFYESVFIWRKP